MKFISRVVAGIVLAATSVLGQTPVERQISLDDCIQQALAKNLDIRIQRYLPDLAHLDLASARFGYDPVFTARAGQNFSTIERGQSVGIFQPPNQEFWRDSYRFEVGGATPIGLNYTMFANMNRDRSQIIDTNGVVKGPFDYAPGIGINLTQPLLRNFLIDQIRYSIAIRKQEVSRMDQSVRAQLISTVANIETAYNNLIASKEFVLVQQKALELAETSLSQNRKRVEVGAMAPLEEKQAESQVSARKADLLRAQQLYANAQNTLRRLIEDDYAAADNTTYVPTSALAVIPLPFSKQVSWTRALEDRPEIVQSKLNLDRQKVEVKFRRNQSWPQLDLTGSFGLNGRDTHFSPSLDDIATRRNPNFSYGIVFSMPLSNRGPRNAYRAARLEQERLLLDYKRVEQGIMVEVDTAILEAQTALRRVEATKDARVFAEAALEAEQKKLENGKSTSFIVLQLQRDLTSARSDELRAIADYNNAVVRVAETEGSTLEKKGIRIESR